MAKQDLGKVIGKNGRTITIMRTILHATRAQKDKRHVLEVLEQGGPRAVSRHRRGSLFHRQACDVPYSVIETGQRCSRGKKLV